MSKRSIPFFWGILLLFCFVPTFGSEVPQDVLKAAEGIKEFAKFAITPNDYHLFGLNNFDEVKSIKAGNCYNIQCIADNALKNASDKTVIDEIFGESNLWYFEADINGVSRFMFIVDFFEGKWQIVSIGYINLLTQILNLNDQIKSRDIVNSKYLIAKSYSTSKYLVSFPSSGNRNLSILSKLPKQRNDKLQTETIIQISQKLYKGKN